MWEITGNIAAICVMICVVAGTLTLIASVIKFFIIEIFN
jgi:hypothetical protein